MKAFVFAYLGGLVASIPAFTMFDDVGASPFRNLDAIMAKIGGSLVSTIIYFTLLWIVPAFGSAIGAKIGGRGVDFRHVYSRGIGGQVAFSIGFSLLLMVVASVESMVSGMPTTMQTVVFLMVSQIGCTLGTVWGF
ncbi:MAG: hypothetical protein KKA73_22675 [Chloroflexi bacterium]|nr:hypothetical protein [Chloroflexota bacterium]MBU1750497.1 hypothetical protein [Chloroflexota bacterium]